MWVAEKRGGVFANTSGSLRQRYRVWPRARARPLYCCTCVRVLLVTVVLLTSTATASPEVRVGVAAHRLYDMVGEPAAFGENQSAGGGSGARVYVAIGRGGVQVRVGLGMLAPSNRDGDVFYGNTLSEGSNYVVSARFGTLGVSREWRIGSHVWFALAGGVLMAQHEVIEHYWWIFDRWSGQPSSGGEERHTIEYRYGGWLDLRFTVPLVDESRHAFALEAMLGYEQLKKDQAASVFTRAGLVTAVGIAYRWN